MLAALIPGLMGTVNEVINRVVPDMVGQEKAKREIEANIIAALNQADLKQLEINQAEAQSGSLFIGGWRPFIGWICGISLGLYYIPYALASVSIWLYMCIEQKQLLPKPVFDMGELVGLLGSLLGMGGLRTLEKIKNVARK